MPGRWRVLLLALYAVALALGGRLLIAQENADRLPWYVALLGVFFILFSIVWIWPRMRPQVLLHVIFALQCLVILGLLALEPEFDWATGFFAVLAFQAALVFPSGARWTWVVVLVVLIAGSLMLALGPIEGLGRAAVPMAVAVALAALAVVSQEIEAARYSSGKMLEELQATHRQLEAYSAKAHDLATLEERNRLARDLHDSVSQAMFSILLATRSAQIMRERDPAAVPEQLVLLQGLTQEALSRMRGFIAELRLKG